MAGEPSRQAKRQAGMPIGWLESEGRKGAWQKNWKMRLNPEARIPKRGPNQKMRRASEIAASAPAQNGAFAAFRRSIRGEKLEIGRGRRVAERG